MGEHHRQHRSNWLRAAVLGANDGIVSIASLIIGVAAANSSSSAILVAGVAGTAAGAISMAAGEYVSVCSQADSEKADLLEEQRALENDFDGEVKELADIYQGRGVERELSYEVARQLMSHDALVAHSRDEIGISEITRAQPLLAAFSSALSFFLGALVPLLVVVLASPTYLVGCEVVFSLLALAVLGGVSSYLGGVPIYKGILRVTFWGALAMGITALAGSLFDVLI